MSETTPKTFTEVKDSGTRQEFQTGSRRDTDEGKGWPHLIAGEPLVILYKYWGTWNPSAHCTSTTPVADALNELFQFSIFSPTSRDQNNEHLYAAIGFAMQAIRKDEDGTFSSVLRRLAVHYQNGAKKYAKHNWRKGQPVSRYYDSAVRHAGKAIDGAKDEDHLAALLWNLLGIMQMKLDVKRGVLPEGLDDFPTLYNEVWPPEKAVITQ